jgi:hypothetical protein
MHTNPEGTDFNARTVVAALTGIGSSLAAFQRIRKVIVPQ